jgi:hypothetical protein
MNAYPALTGMNAWPGASDALSRGLINLQQGIQ